MLGPLLLLQLAASPPRIPTYATAALEVFIGAAAAGNREPPQSLRGYRAHVESELSLILRDTLGREHVAQVEQVALESRWRRGSDYNLHIVGYRSATVGVPYSALSLARSWTVPFLYGDRLTLGVDIGRSGDGKRLRGPSKDSLPRDSIATSLRAPPTTEAVHPLAADRDRFYQFGGGDTIAFVRSGDRVVPIARVRVTPVLDSVPRDRPISVFDGEIEFDASRHQIVRMRGRFVTRAVERRSVRSALARLPGLVAVAFIEFVNGEVGGQFWLPQSQRTEFQATFAPLGRQRSVFRLLSRFSELAAETEQFTPGLADTTGNVLNAAPSNDAARVRRILSYSTTDSISRYSRWARPLGAATADVSSSDFDEFLPDAWRSYGPPRLDFTPAKLDEVFRYDRVEGAYSGLALERRFRDAAPGLALHAYGGWAWAEQTVRGGASVRYAHDQRTVAARVERLLVSTNDFAAPLDAGTIGFSGLLGADDQDYVDRRIAALSLTTGIGSLHTGVFTGEVGLGRDEHEMARLAHGPLGAGSFRINRASSNGSYFRSAATFELHPDITGLFLEPGAGLVLTYEMARGQLSWQRTELTIALRQDVGALTVAGRAQTGIVTGRQLPPQQLFEIGGENALPGYAYKQFAGDRAAVAGALVSYSLPLLRRPWRLVQSLVVPGLSPGFAAGVQGGWAEASSASVLAAIRRLDPLAPPRCVLNADSSCPAALATPTGRMRATTDIRLTLFGGLVGFGVARALDHAAPWRLVFRVSQEY